MIERQVAHLSRLVEDLLDISRVTRGKGPATGAHLSEQVSGTATGKPRPSDRETSASAGGAGTGSHREKLLAQLDE